MPLPKSSAGLNILIVDDHLMFAEALSFMLQAEIPGASVMVRSTVASAVEVMMARVVDLVLLDLDLASESGLDVLERARIVYGQTLPKVLLCSAYERPLVIARAIENGASGFASKAQSAAEIAEAIQLVADGALYLSPTIAPEVGALLASPSGRSALLEAMSARQLAVLTCLGEGLSNKQISQSLNLSENTVKTHLKEIFDKLNVTSRTACIKKAVAEGLLALT